MSRGGFKVNKTSYDYARGERVDWLDTFAEEFAKSKEGKLAKEEYDAGKSAVEVARERNQQSIHEQISAVFQGSNHTVESKVKELQDRTGLTEYLKRASEPIVVGASAEVSKLFSHLSPKMQQDIESFCTNQVHAYRGQISAPALQHELLSTFKQHGLQSQDVNDNDDVARYLNGLIIEELRMNPPLDTSNTELGKIDNTLEDDDNNDADVFQGLMPSNK